MLQSVTPGNFVAITCWRMLHEKWCFTGIGKLTEEENKGFENGPFTHSFRVLYFKLSVFQISFSI